MWDCMKLRYCRAKQSDVSVGKLNKKFCTTFSPYTYTYIPKSTKLKYLRNKIVKKILEPIIRKIQTTSKLLERHSRN